MRKRQKQKQLAKKLMTPVQQENALTEKRRLFCLEYVSSNNATQAYAKIYNCSYNAARTSAYRLLTNDDIQAEIGRLRSLIRDAYNVEASDMIRFCLRVVGANIGDYVSFPPGGIPELKDAENADMSLVEEISRRPGAGFKIRLIDKRWAWDKLDRYFHWTKDAENAEASKPLDITIRRATVEGVTIWKNKGSEGDILMEERRCYD